MRRNQTTAPGASPLVSIIMPTYQRQHIIETTLQTIRNQRYGNWELIIIDNGGDLQLEALDSRIRIFRHSQKSSSSYARNQAIQYIRGDLVCFFDDDDTMYPEYLHTMVKTFLKYPRAKMVRCGMKMQNGRIDYSYATPECCLRARYVTATWDNQGPMQDQRYFKNIVYRNRWSRNTGDIVCIRDVLCAANRNLAGGLRSGSY